MKIKKVILRVREPEPESEAEGEEKDVGELTPPGSPTQEMLRQKVVRQLDVCGEAEAGGIGRARTSRLARAHRQPYQVAREEEKKRRGGVKRGSAVHESGSKGGATETGALIDQGHSGATTGSQGALTDAEDPLAWLGNFWVELKETLAATGSCTVLSSPPDTPDTLLAETSTEVGRGASASTSRPAETHRQRRQAMLEENRATKKQSNAAGPSSYAGVGGLVETGEIAGAGDVVKTEDATGNVEAPTTHSEPQDRPESFEDALSQLRSMLAGVKESLAAGGPPILLDTSTLTNSSQETGSIEPSRMFSANLSGETELSDLEDYEDAIAGPSTQPAGTQNGPEPPIKQEEEEYVFSPRDSGSEDGTQFGEGDVDTRVGKSVVGEERLGTGEDRKAAPTARPKRGRDDDDDEGEFAARRH